MSFFRRPTEDSSSEYDSDEENPTNLPESGDKDAEADSLKHGSTSEEETDVNSNQDLQTDEISDVFFNPSINSISNTIRKSTRLSISNRLHSINSDSLFVQSVASMLELPIVANERCGSWYVPPSQKAGSCYFKSTDGHFGCWSFSLRRLNLGILGLIGQNRGCIIVDSTRRGKSIPDALSKTVPIWCAVMNSVLFPSSSEGGAKVELPGNAVSASERAQISKLIDGFSKQMRELQLDTQKLAAQLRKPMKPVWITRETDVADVEYIREQYNPIYLLSASRYLKEELQPRDSGALGLNFVYIQGAGDDHEGWARGLLPVTYWGNRERLLQTPEAELPELIDDIVKSGGSNSNNPPATDLAGLSMLSKVHKKLAICDLVTYEGLRKAQTPVAGAIVCYESGVFLEGRAEANENWCPEYRTYIPPNKVGSKQLRTKLVEMVGWAGELLTSDSSLPLIIACQTGNNVSVGITLALICQLFDDHGRLTPKAANSNQQMDKGMIRQRLKGCGNENIAAIYGIHLKHKMSETNLRSRRRTGLEDVSITKKTLLQKAKIRQPGPGELTPNGNWKLKRFLNLQTEFPHERGNASTAIQPR
ncbi:hypothetical protein TWF788_005587 [Orbilia oligospora]|uniref:Initiator tRNA phosphoribosyl transferase n=1 Tax=Orbilia oligospora TaxID=2813651 RepID=A0A7C8TZE0_ORBOL|nr:hypothetical protein TWF788_005587 [Orbilia oligospora]